MRIAIAAVPRFAQDDLEWIDRIRSRYDPQRNVIAPHFTLVFPFEVDAAETALQHAASVASQAKPTSFVLRSALAAKDAFTTLSHVFLIPDEGFSSIVALHESLNSGNFTPPARPDIPFIPHVTVGAFETSEEAEAVADDLNVGGVAIAGMIYSMDILELGGRVVREISRIELGR